MHHFSHQALFALQGFKVDRCHVGKCGSRNLVLDRNECWHNMCLSANTEAHLETSVTYGYAREAAQSSARPTRGLLTPSCGCTYEPAFKFCKSRLSSPCRRSARGRGGGRRQDQSEVSSSGNLRSSWTTGLTHLTAQRGICTMWRRREMKKYEFTRSDRCSSSNTGIPLGCTTTPKIVHV